MAWSGVITDSGEQLLQALIGGATLTFTSVQTGSGNNANMQTATALNSPVATGTMTGQIETNGFFVRMKIPAYTTAYTMKEIGLWARTGNASPVLFAVMQDATGIDIPASSSFPDFVYNMSTFIAASNTSSVSFTVDTSSYVSEGEFEEAMGNVVELSRDFYSSTTSCSCPIGPDQKTYIVYSSSSNQNGIMDATYGALIIVSNGKFAQIHKGSAITVSVSNGNLVVTSTAAATMAVVEL